MSSSLPIPTAAKLSSKAVISTLNVGAWRATKAHAGETREVNARHGTKDLAKVAVRICDHPALEAIASLHAEARAAHYELTLPAADKGLRLLPGARQLQHADLMETYRSRIASLVAEFLADYDTERAAAPARLNGLYIASQWPTRDEVASRFAFNVRYLPVPDVGPWADWMAEAATAAQDDLRERLADAIRKVAVKLAEPKGIFRDTLVSNLADLLALAPDLNLADDPQIAALTAQARDLLTHDADTLREDPTARAATATRAAELVSLFNLS